MDDDALAELRRLVVDDRGLRERLLAMSGRREFVDEVIDVARERGIELSADEVSDGLRAARRRHRRQWV